MNRIAVIFTSLALALSASGCTDDLSLEKLFDAGKPPAVETQAAAPDDILDGAVDEDTLAAAAEPEAPPIPKHKPAVSTAEALEIQAALQRLGYDPGPVDGVIGPLTRNAIRAWQTATGQDANGQPTPDIVDRLRQQIAMLDQAGKPEPAAAAPAAEPEPKTERSMLRRLLEPLFGS